MKSQFNEAWKVEADRNPFIREILLMHARMNSYDPADLFIEVGRLLGFRRYTSIERTDYSHFLLNSEWITTGSFAVEQGHTKESPAGDKTRGLSASAFFRHSLWTTAGVFTPQV